MKKFVLAFATISLTASSNLFAAPPEKIDICHAGDEGEFKLLTLPEPAIAAHLRNHDDVLAPDDGDTAVTPSGIELDSSCTVVEVVEPEPEL